MSEPIAPDEDNVIVVGKAIDDILDDLHSEVVYDDNEGSSDIVELDPIRYEDNDRPVDGSGFAFLQFFAKKLGMAIKDKPKASCKKCFGRGYIGRDIKQNFPVPCSCIFLAEDKSRLDNRTFAEMLKATQYNRKDRRARGV